MTETPEPVDLPRVFLVVVDETEEMRVALRFACRRARHTGGRVALLHVIEPGDPQPFRQVEALMLAEQRADAEALIKTLSADVVEWSGQLPVVHLRDGYRAEQLLKLVEEEPGISILVLAAGTGSEEPGPLISQLVGRLSGRLQVPITVVPGNLSDAQIDRLA
ncbi:MAG TPA: universal stress protein [Stellaceae bacterium]|jgi:nucleotide-binding universal stress UspA family protein|nr:universal stress protein [Stellaceae bacterium]